MPMSLKAMLDGIESMTGSLVGDKPLKTVFNYALGSCDGIICDEVRLRQILINLIGNAIKFTDAGNISVNLKVEKTNADHAILNFTVSDTGIGMSKSQLEKIFNKFEQIDSSTRRKYSGTGLGLSICKALTSLMGGELKVDSISGKGTIFNLNLPVELTEKTPQQQKNSKNIQNLTLDIDVLLAEDNKINQMVVMEMLKKIGCRVDVANTGNEAILKVQQKNYSVIIMDGQMPGMDGYEATRKIRAMGFKQIPIVALTADAMSGAKEKCLEAGMNDYISKPVVSEKLIQALLALVS
jgi:CheY-like chemotaxis protein